MLNETIRIFEEEIQSLRSELSGKDKYWINRIQGIESRNKKEIEFYQELLKEKDDLIEELKQEIEYLKSQQNTNSRNSSMSPSTDILNRSKPKKEKSPNEYNTRKSTDRNKGAQEGHDGKCLSKEKARELIDKGKAEHRKIDRGDPEKPVVSTKYILDYEITPVVTEVVFHKGEPIPDNFKTAVKYGENIHMLASLFYSEGVMSYSRIASMINSLGNDIYSVSEGFVYNSITEFSKLSSPFYEKILADLRKEDLLYTDATGFKADNHHCYVRNISSEDAVVYLPSWSKSKRDLLKLPILAEFSGILVSDHERSVVGLKGCTHAECVIHLIRHLRKNTEDTNNNWSSKLEELFYWANDIVRDKSVLSESDYQSFSEKYDKIVKEGYLENKETQNQKFKKKELSLLNRIRDYKMNYVLFALKPEVPFTNNTSERDLRKAVNRRKVIGCFREYSGLETYCCILSVIETLKKRKIPLFSGIRNII